MPVCAAIVWLLVVKGDYKSVEKVFLIASVFYIAYIITGVLSGPDWLQAMKETVSLPPRAVWHDKVYVYMTVGVIGTTITPWMQFYLQSSIVEKGITVKNYKASRLDVDCWVDLFRHRCVVHHCGLRGDALCAWDAQYRGALGRCRRDEAAGRRLRVHPVCGGTVQCVAVRGVHSAALDRIYGLRGHGLGERGR